MKEKPIDFLELDLCVHCCKWRKPDYYEVPSRVYYYCSRNGELVPAEKPCTLREQMFCPIAQGGRNEREEGTQ